MPFIKKRAKSERVYPEDPVYNSKNYKIDWSIICRNIERRRIELNLTQQNLSEITGIPSLRLSQFENHSKSGKHPNFHEIVILMNALKMDANAMFDGILSLKPLSRTEKNLNELLKNISAEIARSELYESASENDKRHMPKPLKVTPFKFDDSSHKVADNKGDFNQS